MSSKVPPFLISEFLAWVWFCSDSGLNTVGDFSFWVGERLSFRTMVSDKASITMTGESPAQSPEARLAFLRGKVLRDMRIGIRKDDREYEVTLAANLSLKSSKLPIQVKGGPLEEQVYDVAFLYEELTSMVREMFCEFARQRTDSAEWPLYEASIQQWAAEA